MHVQRICITKEPAQALGIAGCVPCNFACRTPYNRKCAFDAGDYGLGFAANSLQLGCDCLGDVTYFDGIVNNAAGEPVVIKNAVCLHEEDHGLLWKHVDYRWGLQGVNALFVVPCLVCCAWCLSCSTAADSLSLPVNAGCGHTNADVSVLTCATACAPCVGRDGVSLSTAAFLVWHAQDWVC